jgi:Tol biopolymer transport system component
MDYFDRLGRDHAMGRKLYQPIGLVSILVLLTLEGAPVRGAVANLAAPSSGSGITTRVSVASDGTEGNYNSNSSDISGEGRYVAFTSYASNLVSGDTNVVPDCFVHDRLTGETRRVSVASDGSQGDGESWCNEITTDGHFIVFQSEATNLVSDDTNNAEDVFLHDLQTGQTSRVSLASDGSQAEGISTGPSISADGRYIAFYSNAINLIADDTNDFEDVFLRDRQTNQTTRVSIASDGSQANGDSWGSSISADGRYIAFYSYANNLTSGDDNNNPDVFVHDRQTGQTVCASLALDGTTANDESWGVSISGDGGFVVYTSAARDLVLGDTNLSYDIFLNNVQTAEVSRVTVDSEGHEADSDTDQADLTPDGRYIVYASLANNLDPSCADSPEVIRDIFLHDRLTGSTTCISKNTQGVKGDGSSSWPYIADNGRTVSFTSIASNLVEGDTNNFCEFDGDGDYNDSCRDVFVRVILDEGKVFIPLVQR